MNVSELQSMIYGAASTGATGNVNSTNTATQTVKAGTASEVNTNAFSAALSEEVSKISDAYKSSAAEDSKNAEKVADFRKLASTLDGSVLGTMTANATDADIAALSDDLLGTGKGREVLAKLMEGHFNNIVMSDSDDDSDKDILDNTVDSYNERVSETQALLDGLEKVSTTLSK
ncbi:MAG: hypothetical protein MJ130_06790 [Lachnospiraceae bacterium]|nr:hypothetical protein [Lachnospiraceae bacterium]